MTPYEQGYTARIENQLDVIGLTPANPFSRSEQPSEWDDWQQGYRLADAELEAA